MLWGKHWLSDSYCGWHATYCECICYFMYCISLINKLCKNKSNVISIKELSNECVKSLSNECVKSWSLIISNKKNSSCSSEFQKNTSHNAEISESVSQKRISRSIEAKTSVGLTCYLLKSHQTTNHSWQL